MYHSNYRFYLRSLPFVGAILVFFLTQYLFPHVVSTIIDYIFHTDPEEYFSPEGWSLYALIIPFCIAGLSRFEDNWIFILFLIAFPPLLLVSYWLWEVVAWILFGILFAWIISILKDEGAPLFVLVIAIIIYAICRVFGSFGEGELLAIGDVLFVAILGGYMLVISIIDTLYYDGKFNPSGISVLYILILCITLLCLSDVNNSATPTTKKVVQSTTFQKTIHYCTATSGVNVRYTPASNSTIVGKLKHGQAVEVLEKGTSFTKISYKHSMGETAWVSTKYLSPTKPSTSTTTEKKKTTSNNSPTMTSAKTNKTNTSSNSINTTSSTNASQTKVLVDSKTTNSTTTSVKTSKTNTSSNSINTTSSSKASQTKLLVDSKTALNYKVSSKSGQRIFAISTSASDYQISSKPSWCTIIAKNKGTFEIKYEANTMNVERTGTIQVNAGDALVSIVLVQSGHKGGVHKGHEYVDLGLSIKWATCNIGATKPEDAGEYFAWGETETKKDYLEGNWSGRSSNKDAAKVIWKGNWRMPTAKEAEELESNCTWQYKTQNGIKGYLVTSKINGASIFLPAVGTYIGGSLYGYNEDADYLTTSLEDGNPVRISFSPTYVGIWKTDHGYMGSSIRPVCP